MEKITNVRLPFDFRSNEPEKNFGIHGLDIWFILKGKKGAVQFLVNFGIYLPHVIKEQPGLKSTFGEIMGCDVGYHALSPQYEGQTSMGCEVLPGGQCFYDGSGLRAMDWVKEIFSIRGAHTEERIWEKLEKEYEVRFGVDSDAPTSSNSSQQPLVEQQKILVDALKYIVGHSSIADHPGEFTLIDIALKVLLKKAGIQ